MFPSSSNKQFSSPSRPSVLPKQPPEQWLTGVPSLGIKRPCLEADHVTPYSVGVKKVRRYTSAQEPRAMSPSTSVSHISIFQIVRFLADKVALGQFCLPVIRFSPVSSIPPMPQTHFHLHVARNRSINLRVLETF
jgi:hypothetical protein